MTPSRAISGLALAALAFSVPAALSAKTVPERGLLRLAAGETLDDSSRISRDAAIEVDLGGTPVGRGMLVDLVRVRNLSLADGEKPTDAIFLSGPVSVDADIFYDPSAGVVRARILGVHEGVPMKVTVWGAGGAQGKEPRQFWDHEGDGTWSQGVPGLYDTALFFGDAFALGWEGSGENRVPPFGTLALRNSRLLFRSGAGWPYLSPRRIAGTGVLALSGSGLQTVKDHPCTSRSGVSVDVAYFSAGQDSWLWGKEAPIRIDGPVVMTNGFFRIYRDVTFNGGITADSPYGPGMIERDAQCVINGTFTVGSPFIISSGNRINGTVIMSGGKLTLGKGVAVPRIEPPPGGSFEIRRVNDDTVITPVFWTTARISFLVAGFISAIAALMGLAFFFGVKVRRRSRELEASRRERDLERAAYDAVRRERLRLSMDLHDDFQQLLTSARFRLVAGENFVAEGAGAAGCEQLRAARAALDSAQSGLRATLWTLSEESEGPGSLLDVFRHAISRMAHWQGVVELEQEGEEPELARRLVGRLLMILQEAVGNAIEHGDATKVRVKVSFGKGWLEMTVADNGDGFDPSAVGEARGHFGIRNMAMRAKAGGGTFSIDSAPGRGAVLKVSFPADPHLGK
ncbi:MAG: ATP-binding protein [Kiritimatiellae bacterium]|nr:ATP-binding protein [Kiritimatiellia bacterium]